MTCKFTRLGPSTFVFSCGRPNASPRPPCDACNILQHDTTCAFELRGAKSGQVCGRLLCSRCAVKVGDADMCSPHAKFSVR